MFEYFENIYPWNLAIVTALDMGAVASDIDIACRPLCAFSRAPIRRARPKRGRITGRPSAIG